MRLDEDKLEALRSWGERLRQADGAEPAAVGRAILMLVEEIDRLHIELWHASLQRPEAEPMSTAAPTGDEEEPVASSLHGRLQRALRRDSDSAAVDSPGEAGSGADDDTTSPEAWIDALRRHE